MKPKPFSPLNHFTEPVAIENPLLPWPDLTRFVGGHGRMTLSSQRDFQICNGGALAHHSSALRCANAVLSAIAPIQMTSRWANTRLVRLSARLRLTPPSPIDSSPGGPSARPGRFPLSSSVANPCTVDQLATAAKRTLV